MAIPKEHTTIGQSMIGFMSELWPINRSITGEGIRETLRMIQAKLPELALIEVPSGTKVLDWIVPDEWRIELAQLIGPDGKVLADMAVHNLHVMGYSEAVDKHLSLSELQAHLYSLPDQPNAIPYVTSYYKRNWGFCISDDVRQSLEDGIYHAHIVSEHIKGSLTLGELVIRGETEDEVLISTYCCHPSMANNELSGPCVATYLAQWVRSLPSRKYTYRFVFIPEMIGSAAYLQLNQTYLKKHVIAAFNLTCVGDERDWSFLPSRKGNTYSDKVALHVLRNLKKPVSMYRWTDRGSDESMFCSPGIDLPMVSVMRTKYGVYPEYHTSLDTMGDVVTANGLAETLELHQCMIDVIEHDGKPVSLVLGEPQLGPRGLYPMTSVKGSTASVKDMLNLISYADGEHTLLDIADKCERPFSVFLPILTQLKAHQLIRVD
jgi:aminopeptidase-like protein